MSNTSATGGFIAPSGGSIVEDNALDTILQALVVGVTSLPANLVRPRWQPVPPVMPEETTDWAAVGVIEETSQSAVAEIHIPDGLGSSVSLDTDELSVMVSFYGPNARGKAKLLRTGLMIAQNRESLYGTGMQLIGVPGVSTFVPEIISQTTYRRVDITFRLRRETVLTWPIENILTAPVTATRDGTKNGTDVQSFTAPAS